MNPLAEYQARLEDRRRASQRLEKQFRRIGNARLAAGIAAVVVAFFVFGEVWISVWWLLLPLAVFAALVVVHARVVERLERSQRAIQFYERGLARLEDRWIGTGGETGERFRNPSHLYSEDLDLFGKGSLFELLSMARTRAGEDFLAGWLLAPASKEEVAARHEAVRELGAMLDLREDLAVLGATVRSGLDPDAAARWGEAPEVRFPAGARYIAPVIRGGDGDFLRAVHGGRLHPHTLPGTSFFVEMAYAFFLGAQTSRVTHAVDSPSHDLVLLAELLQRLENETFRAPLLQQLHARLKAGSQQSASAEIGRLGRLGARLDWQRNRSSRPSPSRCCGPRKWPWQSNDGVESRVRTFANGSIPLENSKRCARSASYSYEHPSRCVSGVGRTSPAAGSKPKAWRIR